MKNNNLSLIILALVLILSMFASAYMKHFDLDLNQDFSRWVDVATYFNNITSPFLLLLSIYLFYLTWSNTQEELMNTRKILEKQMDIQLSNLNFDKLEAALETIEVLISSDVWKVKVPLLPDYQDIFVNGKASSKVNKYHMSITEDEFLLIRDEVKEIIKENSILEILTKYSIDSLSKRRYYAPIRSYTSMFEQDGYLGILHQFPPESPGKDKIKNEILEILLFIYIIKSVDKFKLLSKLIEINRLMSTLKEQGYSIQCELLEMKFDFQLISKFCFYAFELKVTEDYFNKLYKSTTKDLRFNSLDRKLEEVITSYGSTYEELKKLDFYKDKSCFFSILTGFADSLVMREYWKENGSFKGFFFHIFDYNGIYKHSQRFKKFL